MAPEIFVQVTPQGVLVTSPIFQNWEEVEVIQEEDRIILQPRRAAGQRPIDHHPAFGLWADREEESTQLAAALRARVENRQDVSS
ncbi:MAG: hypothetical protein D6793_02910 [Thermoflexia bacterium]|nr:MAG: hypothetical protein D6793_02910 [Thermoflexia bacterium]